MDSLWLIMKARAAPGQMPEISEDLLLGRGAHFRASEGPGQGHGDLLPLPYGEFHAALELMTLQGVIALFLGTGDAVSVGALCRVDCG